MDAVERHRLLIDRWFYPCSRAMHAQLGEMYVADPRFAATYEAIRPGWRASCATRRPRTRRGRRRPPDGSGAPAAAHFTLKYSLALTLARWSVHECEATTYQLPV